MNRRLFAAGVAAILPLAASGQQATNSDALDWLVGAILNGDSTGIAQYVTIDATVPSDLVKGREEFGWWIVELNAKMARGYSAFDLAVDAQFSDNDWILAFLTMTVTSRDSGNDATHDWHIAAAIDGGKIAVLHITYWV